MPTAGSIRELSGDEVDRLVADLPTYHLPEGTVPQASLAGIQDKVLLVARPDGVAQRTVRSVMAKVWDVVHSTAPPPGTEQITDAIESLWVRRHWA